MKPSWTAGAALPGGDLGGHAGAGGFDAFLADTRRRYPFLSATTASRMAHAYGDRIERVIDGAASLDALGRDLGGGLSEREAAYLCDQEWAGAAEDILWRRSKLGLHAPPGTSDKLAAWLRQRGA